MPPFPPNFPFVPGMPLMPGQLPIPAPIPPFQPMQPAPGGDALFQMLRNAQAQATPLPAQTAQTQTENLKKLLFKSSQSSQPTSVESSPKLDTPLLPPKPPSAAPSEPNLLAILRNATASVSSRSSRRTSVNSSAPQEKPSTPESVPMVEEVAEEIVEPVVSESKELEQVEDVEDVQATEHETRETTKSPQSEQVNQETADAGEVDTEEVETEEVETEEVVDFNEFAHSPGQTTSEPLIIETPTLHQRVAFAGTKALEHRSSANPEEGIDGVRLSNNPLHIDVRDANVEALAKGELDITNIAHVANGLSDMGPQRSIAVNSDYIAYVLKQSKVRIIHQLTGKLALIDDHLDQVLDIALTNQFNLPQSTPLHKSTSASSMASEVPPSDSSHLLTMGKDSKIMVWQLPTSIGSGEDEEVEVKCLLEIQGNTEIGNGPRFVKAVWSARGDWLAIAGNKGEVWVNKLSELLANKDSTGTQNPEDGRMTYIEDEETFVPGRVIVYEKPIVDLSFSGTNKYLATGAVDGIVRLFELPSIDLLLEFDPHAGTSIGFVELVSLQNELLGILTVADRGRQIKLSNLKSKNHLEEAHSISFDDSEGDEDWFNVVAWDATTRTLAIANALRESLTLVHLGDDSFTYMVEYPVSQPVTSMVTCPREGFDGLEIYVIHPTVVCQYEFPGWGSSEVLREQQRLQRPLYGDALPVIEEPESNVESDLLSTRPHSVDLHYQDVSNDPIQGVTGVVHEAISPLPSRSPSPQSSEEQENPLGRGVEDAMYAAENEGPDQLQHSLPRHTSAIGEERDLKHVLMDEMGKMDERIMTKVAALLKAENEKQAARLQKERLRLQSQEMARQQQLVQSISATLSTNLAQQMENVVTSQLQKTILMIEKSLRNQTVSNVNVQDPAVLKTIGEVVEATVRPLLKDSVREMFAQDVVPAMQKAVNVMFDQVTQALHRKMDEAFGHVRPSSQSTNTRPTSSQSPAMISPKSEPLEYVLTKALGDDAPAPLLHLLSTLTPDAVFKEVSQPVVLSMVHRLSESQDLSTLDFRLEWLWSSLMALDPEDSQIGPHLHPILVSAQNVLSRLATSQRLEKPTRIRIEEIVELIENIKP